MSECVCVCVRECEFVVCVCVLVCVFVVCVVTEAALRPRRSNIITPENSPSSVNTTNVACTITIKERERGRGGEGEGEGGESEREFSGVMILLRRGRSAAKCSSATHYSYCLSA